MPDDGTRIYEPPAGTNVSTVDTVEVDYSAGAGTDIRERERVIIAGTGIGDDVGTAVAIPASNARGLVVRPLPSNGLTTGTLGASAAPGAAQTLAPAANATAVQLHIPDGHSSALIYLSGTFSAASQVFFEGSIDGSAGSWFLLDFVRAPDSTTSDQLVNLSNNTTGLGANPSNWVGQVGAINYIRVRCGTYTAADAIAVQIATSIGSNTTAPVADASFAGAITGAGQAIVITVPDGHGTTRFELTGAFVGAVVFERTLDGGVTWNSAVARLGGNATNVTETTYATGTSLFPSEWAGNVAAAQQFRVRCTAYTSGTVNVTIRTSTAPGVVFLNAVAVTASTDQQANVSARISANRNSISVEAERIIGDSFNHGVDSNLWVTTPVAGGSVTQGSGVQVLDTGATANASVIYQTAQSFYYHSQTAHNWRTGITIPDAGVANNTRRWGVFTASDGYFFQLAGTVLSVVSRIAGVDTVVASTSWNVVPSYVLDMMNHIYEIEWIGNGAIFFIDSLAVHRLGQNVATARTAVLDFPIRYENVNTGGLAQSVKMNMRGTAIQRFGSGDERPRYSNMNTATTKTLKVGPGTLRQLLINTAQLGAQAVIYDNTAGSGTTIATVDLSNSAKDLEYDLDFTNGLTVVTTGAVPADITVVYS